MTEYIQRQIHLMNTFINQYEKGEIDLNTLVHKLEGLILLPELSTLRTKVGSLVGDLEEFNAWILEDGNLPEQAVGKLKGKLDLIKRALTEAN